MFVLHLQRDAAAAVEAIEGDVTDHDMRTDLIQMIPEAFAQVVCEDRKC